GGRGAAAPKCATRSMRRPIAGLAVVAVQRVLVIARGRVRRVEFRAGLDGVSREIDMDAALGPVDRTDPLRRDQHLAAGEPVARIDDHVAHAPALLLDQEILDMADVAVAGADAMAGGIADAEERAVAVLARRRAAGRRLVAGRCRRRRLALLRHVEESGPGTAREVAERLHE